MSSILRFSSTQIVFATRKLAPPAGVRDDYCQRRRERNSANVFRAAVEEDGVLRATKQRNDLVEQAGLNTDVTMLLALTCFRNFKTRQFERNNFNNNNAVASSSAAELDNPEP